MATFEQNTMDTIEKIVRNLDTITNSIVDLYGKIDELNKSVEKIFKVLEVINYAFGYYYRNV